MRPSGKPMKREFTNEVQHGGRKKEVSRRGEFCEEDAMKYRQLNAEERSSLPRRGRWG